MIGFHQSGNYVGRNECEFHGSGKMHDRRKHLCWFIAMVAVALPLGVAGASAAPKLLKGGPHANWTGVWVIAGSYLDTQDGTSIAVPTGRPEDSAIADLGLKGAKLKPEVLKRVAVYNDAMAQGRPLGDRQCRPGGMPGFWAGPFAWEFIQSPDQINLYQEGGSQARRIYLDGRKHPSPDDADPLFQGHSIGRWEGDTLVVDTVNLSAEIDVVAGGTNHAHGAANHTAKSRIVERFVPVASDSIDVHVTVTNPDVLEKPWVFVRHMKRKPGMEIQDYDCQENNRNTVGADGREQAILAPKK